MRESIVRGPVFRYAWGNNARRAELKGRLCVVVARGRMRTVLVEFLDTGERATTSVRALRRLHDERVRRASPGPTVTTPPGA